MSNNFYKNFSKRILDLLICIICISFVLILGLIIALLIKLFSEGPVIHWSKRVGKKNKIFYMPKFRTMKINSPQMATHQLQNPKIYLTKVGTILRKYSLDEIPQIWSVIIGDMSIVGPRPPLYNQNDLIEMRKEKNIQDLLPGITGWAQVNGRDEISLREKTDLDYYYLKNQTIGLDLKIIFITIFKVIFKKEISH